MRFNKGDTIKTTHAHPIIKYLLPANMWKQQGALKACTRRSW